MNISIFDLFKVGLGPSSSHTMGPMTASNKFIEYCNNLNLLKNIIYFKVKVYGSLAWTGKGHGIDKAIILGLCGFIPEKLNPDKVVSLTTLIYKNRTITYKSFSIKFNPNSDIIYNIDQLYEFHSNAIKFKGIDSNGQIIINKVYYSIGGGFVISDDEVNSGVKENINVPYKFKSGNELLKVSKTFL